MDDHRPSRADDGLVRAHGGPDAVRRTSCGDARSQDNRRHRPLSRRLLQSCDLAIDWFPCVVGHLHGATCPRRLQLVFGTGPTARCPKEIMIKVL